MTTLVTRVEGGKAAVYVKPVSGDPLAPFNDPGQHLDKVLFHSDTDFYRVHLGPVDVTVTLPAVAGATRNFAANPPLAIAGQFVTNDVLLLNHSLGYPPNYLIIWNNAELISGDLVQSVDPTTNWRARFLSHWADETGIYVRSLGGSSATGLPSMSFICEVVVFKLGEEAGNVVFDFDTVTGRLTMGKGMFDSDQVLLRAQGQAGDSPYDVLVGPSMGLHNGRTRVVRGNGTAVDEPGYGGSFAAPDAFQGVIA